LFSEGVSDGAGAEEEGVSVGVDVEVAESAPGVIELLTHRFWRVRRRASTLWFLGREIKPAEISETKANEINTEAMVIFILDDQNRCEIEGWFIFGRARLVGDDVKMDG
jgi:hypothetical protein